MNNPNINKNSWEHFWKSYPKVFNTVMLKATEYFAENFKKKFPIEKTDVLLDYGCGPGFFIKNINTECKIIGLDISEKYIEQCKKEFRNNKNYFFYSIKNDIESQMKDIIKEYNVNKILILSVIQYLKNYDELYKILNNIKNSIDENSKIQLYIADILPKNHSMIKDGFDVLINSIKKNIIYEFIKFIFFNIFKNYSKNKKNKLLKVDPSFFIEYGKENKMTVKILKNLTIHSSRYSVIIGINH